MTFPVSPGRCPVALRQTRKTAQGSVEESCLQWGWAALGPLTGRRGAHGSDLAPSTLSRGAGPRIREDALDHLPAAALGPGWG